jgi:hypothetical protein
MWNLLEEVCVSQFFYLIYCYFYYEYRFLRLNQDYSVNFVFQAEDAGKINQYEQKTVKILVRAINVENIPQKMNWQNQRPLKYLLVVVN